ncbi:MAG: DEAD/DEAH box helicase [Quinella sp. 3Q1]|nr:DEAD/DEAH box helicase [Quinella sp. 3Q1]
MTIDGLLDTYEIFAMSEVEKGERFERLMRNFLLTYPVWRGIVSDVWRWKDFPFKNELGGKDLGIDLVVKTVDGDKKFSRRFWISTSDNFTANASEMLKNQSPAVEMINLAMLRRAQVNWTLLDNNFSKEEALIVRKLRDYQLNAVKNAREHFRTNDRGQLIMACGTGKTFTALKIAENIAPDGKILFLVPSISLLSQTLEEWATFAEKPINAVCICSDETATKNFDDEIVDVNLPLPAMTDDKKIAAALEKFSSFVIFSTYQSIDVVNKLDIEFDLIICDEAHRTATTLQKETIFTKAHSNKNVRGKKRIYMTATPKLYKTDLKDTVTDEKKATDWSMDNEAVFGEEFFRISFAEAAAQGYLSEYKVFVFTVNETFLNSRLKKSIDDKNDALTVDDTLKIIGTINALSKKVDDESARLIEDDPNKFIHTAVAFCKTIDDAEQLADDFIKVQENYFADMSQAEKNSFVRVESDFVFGSRKRGGKIESMSSATRANKLHALKNTPLDGNTCRILNNVRCLAEGVDVPALDAIIFMASKKSQVEIVQAVGRVMRTAPHKKFGYIIIPVVVPMNKSPEIALDNSEDFKDVWKIINALRAHDENMNIEIERLKISLESKKTVRGSRKIIIGANPQLVLEDLLRWEDFKYKIYARMVQHVGNQLYWIQWAHKVAEIVERHTRRINEIISVEGEPRRDFYNFLYDLHKTLNPNVTPAEAVDMLAQHLVTRPIFEALFENYSFVEKNPVSQAMQKILDRLEGDGLTKDRAFFARLYNQVRESCRNMGDADDRQRIIIRLYDSFFKFALKKTVDKLGIVYTPVEVVDFILRSVDSVLKKNFGKRISDKNVHIIDPFTGTGTFIVRLIQSGLIQPKDLLRKYLRELHANEIVLLAYYIAAINIENAFHAAFPAKNYQPFEGICFTDTFELYERGEIPLNLLGVMKENSERVNDQKAARIEVIVGNPPYSVGQRSANDNAQNNYYKNLEDRIAATYAAKTNATNKNSLYDSYIKAFRWASDRIDEGVIGFVTNAGWIDGAAMDGLRKCFAEEFAEIYIFNLRGNARTQGEQRRREKDNVFGQGTRTPIAVTILVKRAHDGDAKIFYHDIGDYLTREQKLDAIKNLPGVLSDEFKLLTPNDKGDWINQRGNLFETFISLCDLKNPKYGIFFFARSRGLETGRDAWIYNFSREKLEKNVQTTIDFYNSHSPTDFDPKKFVWTSSARQNKNRGLKIDFDAEKFLEGMYRPFCKTNFYFGDALIHRRGQMDSFFPTGHEKNLLICVNGVGDKKFSVFITDKIADVQFQFNGQCFPLYFYESAGQGSLFGEKMERRDGISDFILNEARKSYGANVSKEDIFYYVYGFLHLPSYREKFSAELKKSLPRIILTDKFWELSRAGRQLAEIHLNYESQPAPEVQLVIRNEEFGIKKMRLSADKTTLYYNEHIEIKNIPPRSFEYVVNGRSPLEWIIDRYQIKKDKPSGIINDPNAWAAEHGNPRYILDLILSCITVSLKTLDIVENLPEIDFDA